MLVGQSATTHGSNLHKEGMPLKIFLPKRSVIYWWMSRTWYNLTEHTIASFTRSSLAPCSTYVSIQYRGQKTCVWMTLRSFRRRGWFPNWVNSVHVSEVSLYARFKSRIPIKIIFSVVKGRNEPIFQTRKSNIVLIGAYGNIINESVVWVSELYRSNFFFTLAVKSKNATLNSPSHPLIPTRSSLEWLG